MKLAWVIALVAGAVTAAPALARPPAEPSGNGGAVLDIPYVPQSEALCGGAAAAMVLRYWGARDVVAEDFAPLLDADKAGIRVGRLADGVRARGWDAVALEGTAAIVRDQLARRRPVIALVSVGRGQYHYVVLAAWNDRGVIAHDPARAPDRMYRPDDFEKAWAKARHWMLVITPGATDTAARPKRPDTAGPNGPAPHSSTGAGRIFSRPAPADHHGTGGGGRDPASQCDALVANAVDRANAGDGTAESLLLGAVHECPHSPAAYRELAGYRLVHGVPDQAVTLAADAVGLDPGDGHAWYLLGAARYLTHDAAGALDAWNHIGEPRLDLITVEGLENGSYRSIADTVGVGHGSLVTRDDVARAARRVADLPAVASSRVEVVPRGEGLAQVDVGIVERSTVPRTKTELLAEGARAAIDREITETFANLNGSSDAWTGSWRWWANRPRVGFGVAAPGLFGTHAVWRLDAAWEAQSYAVGGGVVRTERTRGALAASDWITPHWKWRATSGLDRWTDRGAFWFGGGGLDRRSSDDRAQVGVDASVWAGAARFAQLAARASWTSRVVPQGWRVLTGGGAALATAAAPVDLWAGAGAGHARAPLLRAHPLLDGGIVTGPAFGRAIEHATISVERWPAAMKLWGAGVAVFVDAASVQHRLAGEDARWFADAGVGLRLRAAWLPGIVRVDYAHGVRDGANAVSVGWLTR